MPLPYLAAPDLAAPDRQILTTTPSISTDACAASPTPHLSAPSPAPPACLPDVLLDRVQLALACRLPGWRADDEPALRFALVRAGVLAPGAAGCRAGEWLAISFEHPVQGARAPVRVGGRLRFVALPAGGLVVCGRSALRPELMRAVRGLTGDPGGLALDRRDNLVGPCGPEWPRLLGAELDLAAAAVDGFLAALASAAGVPVAALGARVTVQVAEVCRDRAVRDAVRLAAELAAAPLPGAADRGVRLYGAGGDEACVSWWPGRPGRRGPGRVTKAYAKRADLLRIEVVARRRRAAVSLGRAGGAAAGGPPARPGEAVAAELARIAAGAAPLLDRAWQFATGLDAAEPSGAAGLCAALAPLAALAEPPAPAGPQGGRPRVASARDARRLLGELMSTGRCDARGMPTSSGALRVLRQLERSGDLCADPAEPRLFVLPPRHDLSRRAGHGGG